MDWLRIGAFALLILYHVGLAFSRWPYELKAVRTYEWVAFPLLALNAWRLSLLFAISGYASAAVFARAGGPAAFLRGRLARLGIPLLFGMAVVTAPQPWVWLRMASGYRHDFAWFMVHDYFSFRDIDGIVVPSWMHLWFVVYLLAYTLVLCALALLPQRWRSWLHRAGERVLAGPLLLPAGVALIYAARRIPGGWSDTHDLIGDPAAHAAYLPVFFFGVLLRRSEPLREAIARQWKLAAVLAVVGYAAVAGYEWHYPGDTPIPDGWQEPFRIGRAAQAWGAIIALFGIADLYWNREGRWRATLAEAVFPFYIIHQTVILVTGYWLRPLRPTPLLEFAVLVGATAAGCWLFYLVGRNIRPLRPLIGLKRHARRPQAPIEPPPGADPAAAPG
jgi:surface polysaccharide O-acyltransferase-like enzyme